jgi:hypothetical protein
MAVNILTLEDLNQFKVDFLEDQKAVIAEVIEQFSKSSYKQGSDLNGVRWLKSHQVQRMLSISPGTLQTLRINGTIPYTKIGGVILYSPEDIQGVLVKNKRNIQ